MTSGLCVWCNDEGKAKRRMLNWLHILGMVFEVLHSWIYMLSLISMYYYGCKIYVLGD